MRRFFIQLQREIAAYFRSPLAYVVWVCYLLITGFNFHFGISALNLTTTSVTIVEAFFNTVFFWFPFVLVFPLITMRLFSEEYKMGTIEPLMTAPVRDGQVVMAKFFSALFFFCVLWMPSFLYFVVFQWQTRVSASEAGGAYLCAYLMLLLIGMFYISIGCLASALSKNQIVAAILSFCAITLMFFLGMVAYLFPTVSPAIREWTGYLSAIEHMMEFSSGILDTRPFVWYLSMTALMLYCTFQVFQSRKWRSQ